MILLGNKTDMLELSQIERTEADLKVQIQNL